MVAAILMLVLVLVAEGVRGQDPDGPLEEVFAWKKISFQWPSEEAMNEAIKSGQYVPENNVPVGLDRWRDKLFITVPRWKSGTASALNYISLSSPINKNASLIPYPNWEANALPLEGQKIAENQIVSPYRAKVDSCDRLWVMDSGLEGIITNQPKQVTPDALLVFDLKTDKLLRRYELKASDKRADSSFVNIVIDVTPETCDQAYAYIIDPIEFGVVVYSWAKNDSWRVRHNFFHLDPLKGNFNVGGINFRWSDGVFGLALGPILPSGYRMAYFHALAGTKEFSVSTEVLQNKALTEELFYTTDSYYKYNVEGDRGEGTQSSSSVFDEPSNTLFLSQVNRDGVACWNVRRPLRPQTLALIAQDHEKLIFANDLTIDPERYLWVFSDQMPVFAYRGLDFDNNVNFRIFRGKVDDLIRDTLCAV